MMLRNLKLCAALLLTVCTGSLTADFGLTGMGGGQWTVTGEYLCLKPSIDDTYYVISSPVTTTFPNGTRENNDFKFHPGFRVGGTYTFCDCNCKRDLGFYYSRLGFNQSETTSGEFLWATVGRADLTSAFENYAGSATSSYDYRYQRFDALYGQEIYNCCGIDLALQFGLEAAELRLNEGHVYETTQTLGTTSEHSKTWGIGPQLGMALGYDLFSGSECIPGTFSFNVLSSTSILAGHSETSASNVLAGATILDVSDSKTWRVIPAFHLRFGVDYDFDFSCVDASVGVGYQFSTYLRGLTRVGFPDDVADGLCYSNYYNYDLQGLYVTGSIKF